MSMEFGRVLEQAGLRRSDDQNSCRGKPCDVGLGERESASACVDAAAVDWMRCRGCDDCCRVRTWWNISKTLHKQLKMIRDFGISGKIWKQKNADKKSIFRN